MIAVKLLTAVNQLQLRILLLELQLYQGRRAVRKEAKFFQGLLEVSYFTKNLANVATVLKIDFSVKSVHGLESVKLN